MNAYPQPVKDDPYAAAKDAAAAVRDGGHAVALVVVRPAEEDQGAGAADPDRADLAGMPGDCGRREAG